MEHLQGPKITGQMIQEVITHSAPGVRLWLVCSKGVWNVVMGGAVDGTEDHVLTYGTVLSQTIRTRVGTEWRFECELAAMGFNSMFFKLQRSGS